MSAGRGPTSPFIPLFEEGVGGGQDGEGEFECGGYETLGLVSQKHTRPVLSSESHSVMPQSLHTHVHVHTHTFCWFSHPPESKVEGWLFPNCLISLLISVRCADVADLLLQISPSAYFCPGPTPRLTFLPFALKSGDPAL